MLGLSSLVLIRRLASARKTQGARAREQIGHCESSVSCVGTPKVLRQAAF
jgi:hypothetical protein